MKSAARVRIEERKMKAFISSLFGIVVIVALAWGGLHLFDFSTQKAGESETGSVRLE